MILIFCADDRGGLLFNNRRLSCDEKLCSHILNYCNGRSLWMNEYSSSIFPRNCPNIRVDEDFPERVGEGDLCFAENIDIPNLMLKADQLVIYRWNRAYPADRKLPGNVLANRTLVYTEEFEGKSHPKITQEVYE